MRLKPIGRVDKEIIPSDVLWAKFTIESTTLVVGVGICVVEGQNDRGNIAGSDQRRKQRQFPSATNLIVVRENRFRFGDLQPAFDFGRRETICDRDDRVACSNHS